MVYEKSINLCSGSKGCHPSDIICVRVVTAFFGDVMSKRSRLLRFEAGTRRAQSFMRPTTAADFSRNGIGRYYFPRLCSFCESETLSVEIFLDF